MWLISTPDDTLIWIPVHSPDDEGRAQFIVDACNAAEQARRIYVPKGTDGLFVYDETMGRYMKVESPSA